MNKARRLLRERSAKSDLLIEVLDARLPSSSRNPLLGHLRERELARLCVLTKIDLADPVVTRSWSRQFSQAGTPLIEVVATQPGTAKTIVKAARALVPERGRAGFPVRVMIAGVPNVGKSTLFNTLLGRSKALVRDQPAVTQREQQLEVPGGLVLVDTPGVLWPKLDDPRGAYCLAASGAIRDAVLDVHDVARFVVELLTARYPEALPRRFKLASVPEEADALLDVIGRKSGCMLPGARVDVQKVSELLLRELRAGRLGRVSLERPDDTTSGEQGQY